MKTTQEQVCFFNKALVHQIKEAEWDAGFVCTVHNGKFASGMSIHEKSDKVQTKH